METGRTDRPHTPGSPAPKADTPTDSPAPASPADSAAPANSARPTASATPPTKPDSASPSPQAESTAPPTPAAPPTKPGPTAPSSQADCAADSASPSAPASPANSSRARWPQVIPHQAPPTAPQPPELPHPPAVPRRARPPVGRAHAGSPLPGPGTRRPEAAPGPPRAHASHPVGPQSPGTPRPEAAPRAPRAHASHPVGPPPPRYNQHRQQPEGLPEADPVPLAAPDPEARRAAHRARATGFATGVLHTLGFTLLSVYEYFRATASTLTSVQRAAGGPGGLREIAALQADLARESWYGFVADVTRTVTFDQPRAALWSAVFVAVLVRLNRSGPPRVQLALSVVAGGYCALLALLWFPFLYALGSVTFLALAASGALLWAATRR